MAFDESPAWNFGMLSKDWESAVADAFAESILSGVDARWACSTARRVCDPMQLGSSERQSAAAGEALDAPIPSGPRHKSVPDRPRVLALLSLATAQAMQRLLAELRIDFEGHAALAELVRGELQSAAPSLVLLDLDLAQQDAGVLLQVQQRFPRALLLAMGHDLTGNRSAALLVHGIVSLCKPQELPALASLVARLSSNAQGASLVPQQGESSVLLWRAHLSRVLRRYMSMRALSAQQQTILDLYLAGEGDKEIASTCGCSLSTVYEHWRRMARKVGGTSKQHVIADFHRFLAGR